MGEAAAHVMVTAEDVAARDGIGRKAVQKIVRKLADLGMPVERDGRGRIKRFSQAWYDQHRERHGDSIKSQKPAPVLSATDSLDEARRQQAWLAVDRENLKKQELAGSLVRTDRLEEALAEIGNVTLSIVQKLPNKADELAVAVSKEGVHGLRLALRKVAFDISTDIADKLEQLAKAAPKTDALVGEDGE